MTCSNGLAGIANNNGDYCCAEACGQCGGHGCASRGGDDNICCTGKLIDRLCSQTGEAPCFIDDVSDSGENYGNYCRGSFCCWRSSALSLSVCVCIVCVWCVRAYGTHSSSSIILFRILLCQQYYPVPNNIAFVSSIILFRILLLYFLCTTVVVHTRLGGRALSLVVVCFSSRHLMCAISPGSSAVYSYIVPDSGATK